MRQSRFLGPDHLVIRLVDTAARTAYDENFGVGFPPLEAVRQTTSSPKNAENRTLVPNPFSLFLNMCAL